jgi:hypothetical protein
MPDKFKTITSFIKSSNRATNEKPYSFSIDYPDGILTCGAGEYMEINVISFDMINTMYNINNNNNQFILRRGTTYTTYTIPEGNYSVKTFMAMMSGLMNDPHITITYNTAQNTYTFTKKAGITQLHYIIPSKIWGIINLLPTIEYNIPTTGLTTGYVNLVNYSKIILRTEGVNYFYSNIENFGNPNNSTLSNIIFWKTKSDIEPFALLSYNNEDGGNSFCYKVENKEINNLTLKLMNENNELITDAPDYLVVLQFNFYKQDDNTIKTTIISINRILNEIYASMIYGMKRLGLLA